MFFSLDSLLHWTFIRSNFKPIIDLIRIEFDLVWTHICKTKHKGAKKWK